jgi:hypothetical protein
VTVKQARLSIDPTFRVGEIDQRLWGPDVSVAAVLP